MPVRSLMKSAFPFKDPQTDHLHRSVVATIQRLDYHFQLPCLNEKSWSTICNNASERERLEFVGDALIGAFIAEELYRQRPDGGPGYYTIAKSVLTANSTFAHLMHKAGLFHDLSLAVKPAGDAFETILAAFHTEQGAEAFQTYTRQYFLPLIETVGLAYDAFRINNARQRKHRRMTLKPMPPLGSKQHKIIKNGKSRAKANNFRTTTLSVNTGIPKRTGPPERSPTSIRAPVVVIDLTEDNDTEEQSCSDSEIQEFRFSLSPKKIFKTGNQACDLIDPDQASVLNNTAVDSYKESQDLLRFISTSPAVVSARKDSEDETRILSPPSVGGHTTGEDAVEDDLVIRFKNASLLGTIHNPITID